MQATLVRPEIHGAVGLIVLQRSPRNALNRQLLDELITTFTAFEQNPEIGAVVITGGLRNCFSIGADLDDLFGADLARKIHQGQVNFWEVQEYYQQIATSSLPTIAAINGVTIGAGLELALVCDLRIATDTALFALPEAALGIIPGIGATQRLTRLIGEGRAKEMLFLGRFLRATRALEWGLVNALVPRRQLLDHCLNMAAELARKPRAAMQGMKAAINSCAHWQLEEMLRIETEIFTRLLKRKLQI